ncbi:hypothetical protein [Nocardioides speluncae]|uniref:hypothetical protein n=1 Tax=Nocardioides speluncae TaxID=2670337 RepID=UPI0012B184FF|nr:hypothetical protein [Nocardioides speluncae]
MRFCGTCGTENTLGHPFCGNCGQDLRTGAASTGDIPPTEPPPVGPTGTMPPTDRDDLRDSLGTSPFDPLGATGSTGPTGTMPPQPPPVSAAESTSQLPAYDEQAPSHTHYADNPRHSPPPQSDPTAPYQQQGHPQQENPYEQFGWQQPTGPQPGQQSGQQSQLAALAANPVVAKLLVGNWRGAGIVAGAALGIAAALSLLLAAMLKQDETSIDQMLTLFGVLLAGTFGAGVSASGGDDEMSMSAGAGAMPLTLSLIALGAAVYLFRKQTAGYPRVLDALGDAARTAFVVAVPLFFVSIVFRSDFGGGIGEDMGTGDGSFGASRFGSLFMTFIVVFSVLAISCFMRRDWLPEKAQKVHDLLAAPIWGFTALLVALPVAGIVGGILLLLGGDDGFDPGDRAGDTDLMATMAMIFAGLANAGYALIGLGSLVPVGFKLNLGGFGPNGDAKEMERLAHWAENDPGLWLAPLVTLGVLAFATSVVVRRSPAPGEILRNLACWLGLLVIALPVLSRFASLHAKMRVKADSDEGDFSGKASAYLGVDGFLMLVMVLLITALIAFGLALFHGVLDWNQLTQQAKTFASSVQAHPGQPQQQQQQPPHPQQWQGGYPPQPPTQQYQQPPQQPPYQQGPPVYGEPQQPYGQPPYGQPPNEPPAR